MELDQGHPRNLIPELCNQFYHLGWVTGTSGGISIKQGNKIYCSPEGMQKEHMKPDDLFVVNYVEDDHRLPKQDSTFNKDVYTPMYMFYRDRSTGAVIHSHSPHAVLCTLLWTDKEFRITHQEMIKGIKDVYLGRYLRSDESLVVPIIENTRMEQALAERITKALLDYPGTSAVLIRRHGLYVWGDTWQQAKTMTECYDYLFELAVEMKKLGLDPELIPELTVDVTDDMLGGSSKPSLTVSQGSKGAAAKADSAASAAAKSPVPPAKAPAKK